MRAKHCNHCWAKGSDGRCLATPETRIEHCARAIARLDEKSNTNHSNESKGLKDYLRYIANHIDYLQKSDMVIQSNEYKYYSAMQNEITRWGKNHRVFYEYLLGKIGADRAKSLYGVSEREFYRIASRQRKLLIKLIESQEMILERKYPFIPVENIQEDYSHG